MVHVVPARNRTLYFINTPSKNMLCQKPHFFLPQTHLLTCMLKHSLRFWRHSQIYQNHEEHGRIPETKLLEKCKHFKEKCWLQLNLYATRRWASNMLPEESGISFLNVRSDSCRSLVEDPLFRPHKKIYDNHSISHKRNAMKLSSTCAVWRHESKSVKETKALSFVLHYQ